MKSESVSFSDSSTEHDRAIGRFASKIAALLALKYALTFTTIWSFCWGTLALALRAGINMPRRPLLWGAAGVVLAVGLSLVLARRRSPSRANLRALLDEQSGCGGLLMAAADAELGSWHARMPAIREPHLRWRNRRTWALFVTGTLFVAFSLLVPVRLAAIGAGRTLDVSQQVEKLAAEIEMLKEEQIIAEAKAEALEQKLNQLSAEASGEDPVKTWEALDHLADAVQKAAREAAEAAMGKQERLTRAEALAEGLISGADSMDAKLATEAMQTLSEMMQEAMKENQQLARDLSPETQQAIKSGALKPEHLKEMAKALSQNKAALNQSLAKLRDAGMIDARSLKGGAPMERRDNAGLAQFLKENAEKMSVDEAVGQWCQGKGGVDRGRGDAAMTWTDGSSEKGAKFKEQTLPPAAIAGLRDSQLVGLSTGAPSVEKNGPAAHGALNRAAAGGGSAYTQTILPRHRGAVKRYFERPQGK
jgi:cell division protein FtsB